MENSSVAIFEYTILNTVTYDIDNDVLIKLKEKAEYDDRSLSQYINLVLKQHINNMENKK